MNLNQGDIVWGKYGSDAVHPIVFISDIDHLHFLGAMLTSSQGYASNVKMNEDHFEAFDEDGNKYRFQFNNTHIVNQQFLKKKEWAPFKKSGRLSEDGIKFVLALFGKKNPMLWEHYLDKK